MPTAFVWATPVYALTGSYIKLFHPWDVNKNGEVYYGTGESHAANWAAIYCLDAITGNRKIVNNWLTHWYIPTGQSTTTEYKYGAANTFNATTGTLQYSGIPLKHGRCDFRSMNSADYNFINNDENGNPRRGKMPWDFLFSSECNPVSPSTAGRGYNNNANGYAVPGSTSFVFGVTSITCDKRNNWMYLGLNSKSSLPGGNPDFEPVVVAYNNDAIAWWARCYQESSDGGTTPNTSTPDQYIDAIAIDYSKPVTDAELVVAGRQHGNNTIAMWSARSSTNQPLINANSNAAGFKNRFMGSSGNIHIGWLGRFKATTGVLYNATYVAEITEGASNYGAASTDSHLDGWPDPNSGNANLNTTYINKNQLQITGDGHVLIIAQGRRTLTTANAFQKMPPPSSTATGSWNYFVREYRKDLSYAKYSSILTGAWNQTTGAGGDNVELYGVCKTQYGIIAVGQGKTGNAMPTVNVPAWGSAIFSDSTGVISYFQQDSIASQNDNGIVASVLPVNIYSFNGYCNESGLQLNWRAGAEINMLRYEIEAAAERINFKKIGIIAAENIAEYPYKVKSTEAQYFRLKLVNRDDTYTYSNIIFIKSCNNNNRITLAPNPTNGDIEIKGLQKNTTIKLYDQLSRIVYEMICADVQTQKINIQNLPKGLYYMNIVSPKNSETIKIVLQ